jgi:hypothetical protein
MLDELKRKLPLFDGRDALSRCLCHILNLIAKVCSGNFLDE